MEKKGGGTRSPFAWFQNPLQPPTPNKSRPPSRSAPVSAPTDGLPDEPTDRPTDGPTDGPMPASRRSGVLTRLREVLRRKHYAAETEKSYVAWVRRFIRYHKRRHPRDMGAEEVTEFLEYLAVERNVSAKTQNLALSAIVFFYRNVLDQELEGVRQSASAKVRQRLPVVLNRAEAEAVLSRMRSTPQLVAQLMYGSGLRLREALQLRVKDLDFDTPALFVREGKGGKDRVAILPRSLIEPLRSQLKRVRELHERDLRVGAGYVQMPHALALKYPTIARSLLWQWLFPATRIYVARENGERRRHHLHPTAIQREVRSATLAAGILKRVTCHTFRHSFATELLNNNIDIRTIQKLLGHKSVKTTMLYTHLSQDATLRVESPMDQIARGSQHGRSEIAPTRVGEVAQPANESEQPVAEAEWMGSFDGSEEDEFDG